MLTGYGTGAIMAVPAHDERDFEFCAKYRLPIPRVIKLADSTEADDAPVEAAFTNKDETAIVINSGKFSGLKVPDAIKAMTEYAEAGGFGEAKTNFKIRDWGVSRQRAWGTPLPFIHCSTCGIVPVPEDQLPVELPSDLNFNTAGAPLAEHAGFVNVACPTCDGAARRDTDTMDTFVDSSWYYFRYCDPKNDKLPFAPEVAAYWTPVDQYIGGIEHAVLHLIYTRLWTKIMRDLGLITFGEPVKKLLTQGMVCLATYRCEEHDWLYPYEVIDGKCKFCQRPATVGRIEKMSKSKKNTVDPDEMIKVYGADTVRLFMMFAAPPEKDLEWSEAGAEGGHGDLHAGAQAAVADALGEQDRDGGGGGVAVALDVVHQLVLGQAELLRDVLVDPQVRLVGGQVVPLADEPVEAAAAAAFLGVVTPG